MACYRYDTLTFSRGIFDSFVDATVVLTMEESPRHSDMMRRLRALSPSRLVYIQYNMGYRACAKRNASSTTSDLAHANLAAFDVCKSFRNVLILEDDFLFDDAIFNASTLNTLRRIATLQFDIFNLGGAGSIHMLNTGVTFPKLSYMVAAHAILYSREGRRKMAALLSGIDDRTPHDTLMTSRHFDMYTFYKPLMYQTWPETDNQQQWGSTACGRLLVQGIRILGLDYRPQPGFNIIYGAMWGIYLIKLAGVLLLVHLIIRQAAA